MTGGIVKHQDKHNEHDSNKAPSSSSAGSDAQPREDFALDATTSEEGASSASSEEMETSIARLIKILHQQLAGNVTPVGAQVAAQYCKRGGKDNGQV